MVPYLQNCVCCKDESFKVQSAQSGVALSWPGEDLWLNLCPEWSWASSVAGQAGMLLLHWAAV